LKYILSTLSGVYKKIIHYRNQCFDNANWKITYFPVKVIAIGNLTLGGTGKTPMAAYIIEVLLAKGFRVAYLSRGYGRKTSGFRLFVRGQTKVTEIGDEAYQIALQFPTIQVAVCEKRKLGAKILLERFALDYIVLDDAFQHRQIGRNLDIVMIDANNPPYKDALLPLGRLREPIENLQRANAICINKCPSWDIGKEIEEELKIRCAGPLPPLFLSYYAIREPILRLTGSGAAAMQEIKKNKVLLIAALANNEAFEALLKLEGINIIEKFFFRDHRFYTEKDLQRVNKLYQKLKSSEQKIYILTTEKDAAKLNAVLEKNNFYQDLPIFVVRVKLAFYEKSEQFEQLLF
jgi:tetraacyldisaccharide 4'-kinase